MGDERPSQPRVTELEAIATIQGGVITRAQLYRAGVSRGEVRAARCALATPRRALHRAAHRLARRRRTPQGSYYLDMRWRRWKIVVEVDGIQHNWAENLVADAVRHNAIAIEGDTVLRLPVLGLRLTPSTFFGQIRTALIANGWRDDLAA